LNVAELEATARQIRIADLKTVYAAGAGHIGGELSAIDILTTLYFHTLKVDPAQPQLPTRDRFILSKGHTACALYTTLGMAKAAKLSNQDWRVFVLCGDGELQEGSNWEAAMAAAQFKLDNLVLIVDHNGLQQGASVTDTNDLAPLLEKFIAFGWATATVNGHDISQLCDVLDGKATVRNQPKCIVANTQKGRGISFMQDRAEWHHKVPNKAQFELALQELQVVS